MAMLLVFVWWLYNYNYCVLNSNLPTYTCILISCPSLWSENLSLHPSAHTYLITLWGVGC